MRDGPFAVIQYDPRIRPSRAAGRIGVLEPINMDGFWHDFERAREVAEYMAECHPDLQILVVKVLFKHGANSLRHTSEKDADDFDGMVIEPYPQTEAKN
jgi:hypothetical protein